VVAVPVWLQGCPAIPASQCRAGDAGRHFTDSSAADLTHATTLLCAAGVCAAGGAAVPCDSPGGS
jgi:hypothetical protein